MRKSLWTALNTRRSDANAAECVEFLDARTMGAINKGGLAGRQYQEKESLFFKFQG
jgi:D-lactate dehydrogenase (cytochrome)